MKNTTYLTDEDRWQAVLARDPHADNQFVRPAFIVVRPAVPATRCVKMSAFILMLTRPRRRVSAPVSAVGRTRSTLRRRKRPTLRWPADCLSRMPR